MVPRPGDALVSALDKRRRMNPDEDDTEEDIESADESEDPPKLPGDAVEESQDDGDEDAEADDSSGKDSNDEDGSEEDKDVEEEDDEGDDEDPEPAASGNVVVFDHILARGSVFAAQYRQGANFGPDVLALFVYAVIMHFGGYINIPVASAMVNMGKMPGDLSGLLALDGAPLLSNLGQMLSWYICIVHFNLGRRSVKSLQQRILGTDLTVTTVFQRFGASFVASFGVWR